MRPYAVFIHEHAIANAPRSGAQREAVMKFIRSLAENPNAAGDFTEKDSSGRTVQVKVIGRHAITFWADHAVSEVKVTYLELADN
jgi:hypothetical protein